MQAGCSFSESIRRVSLFTPGLSQKEPLSLLFNEGGLNGEFCWKKKLKYTHANGCGLFLHEALGCSS
jgi:hypothetical protein